MTKPTTYTITDAAGRVLFSDTARDGEHAMDCMAKRVGVEFNVTQGMTIARVHTYRFTSKAGANLGDYEGTSPDEAHDALARDAGYRNAQDLAKALGRPVEDLRAGLIIEQL